MGKSIRSKSKRAYRRTKRETGTFAAADAARLQRLSLKLAQRKEAAAPAEDDVPLPEAPDAPEAPLVAAAALPLPLDETVMPKPVVEPEELDAPVTLALAPVVDLEDERFR